MSYGAFVQASIDERRAATKQRDRQAKDRAEQRRRAVTLVLEHLPETTDERTGTVCGWAVMAVLNLWREHGEGNVKLSQVRRERARLLRRLETHGPNASRSEERRAV